MHRRLRGERPHMPPTGSRAGGTAEPCPYLYSVGNRELGQGRTEADGKSVTEINLSPRAPAQRGAVGRVHGTCGADQVRRADRDTLRLVCFWLDAGAVSRWELRAAGISRLGSDRCGWRCQVGPRTRAISARIRVKRASVASAERRCSAASAATGAPRRLAKRDRITSALSARTPRVKSAGSSPAAKAISRHRHMSDMSVSLDRTVVARLFSTRALTSRGTGARTAGCLR